MRTIRDMLGAPAPAPADPWAQSIPTSHTPVTHDERTGHLLKLHFEARPVRYRGLENNIAHDWAALAVARRNRPGGAFALDAPLLDRLGGRGVGEGQYGTAVKVVVDASVKTALAEMRESGSQVQTGTVPKLGDEVVVKFQEMRRVPNETPGGHEHRLVGFLGRCARESFVHKRLASSASCVRLACSGAPACPAVPRFHFAAFSHARGSAGQRYVCVMGLAPGVTLSSYLRREGLTADLYARVEKAVASLWMAGVIHADLHRGNIVYDPGAGTVTIIDFGWAVIVPAALKKRVADALEGMVVGGARCLGEAWNDLGVAAYADRVLWTRKSGHIRWYNADGRLLVKLYNMLSARQRALVPGTRAALWGCALRRGASPGRTNP